jgi:hypothetical protein
MRAMAGVTVTESFSAGSMGLLPVIESKIISYFIVRFKSVNRHRERGLKLDQRVNDCRCLRGGGLPREMSADIYTMRM